MKEPNQSLSSTAVRGEFAPVGTSSWKSRLGVLLSLATMIVAVNVLVPWPAQAAIDDKAPCPVDDSGQSQCGPGDDGDHPGEGGPGDLGTCTIPPHGGNPCDDDERPDGGPDDFGTCRVPTHGGNPCDEDRPDDGDEPGDGGDRPGDGGGGGGDRPGDDGDRPGDGGDRPGDGGGGKRPGGGDSKKVHGILVPNRVDTGAGGTADTEPARTLQYIALASALIVGTLGRIAAGERGSK